MKNDAKNNVRDWTEEDEKKYREMLATPVKRLTEEGVLKLAAVSPHPPLGARIEREGSQNTNNIEQKRQNQPQFTPFDSDLFTEKIAETANKTAQVSHDLEMKRIKAKLIADLCTELVRMPIRHEDVPQRAREIADKALENL